MAIELKVTPEVLTRMAQDIDHKLGDIKTQFDGIDSDINRTLSFWEGDASDSHKKQYDAMKDEIQDSLKRLKGQPEKLLRMAGLYSETEAQQVAVAQTLSADVII